MREKSDSSSSSQEHYHLHYHYYYPAHMRTNSKEGKDKKSQSFSKQTMHKTPKQKGRMKTQGDDMHSLTEVKKMRLSDMSKLKQSNYFQSNHQQFSNKAKSELEGEDESQFMGKDSFLKKSIYTGLQTQSNQLVSYYQSQLAKFQAEITRLKMVEEQCIYLRDAFYNHYTQKCPKYL